MKTIEEVLAFIDSRIKKSETEMSEYESENGCDPYDECWIAVNSQTEGELAALKELRNFITGEE